MRLTRGSRGGAPQQHPWEELATTDYFAGLPGSALRTAARGADRCDVDVGTRLQRQGMHLRWVWIVVSGALEARRDGDVVALVLPGASHGEPEVLLGEPSRVELVAATPATVLSLPAPYFHGLLAEPAFASGVARRLARRVLHPAEVLPQPFGSSGASTTSTTRSVASA